MPLVPLRSWGGRWLLRSHVLLNCFSEQSSLKILFIWQFCPLVSECSLESPESQNLSHRGGRLKEMRSQCQCDFLAKLSNKEIYKKKKVTLRHGLVNLIACPIGDVLTPLNCCKVLVGNTYKVLQGKYKMTPIIKNVCPGWWKAFVRVIYHGLPVNILKDQNHNDKI
jgi:hypothetical protein